MSTIENIFNEAKTRCDLLRESIDRGLYDSTTNNRRWSRSDKTIL